MQGDDGLAGARAAGDLGDATGGGPDRLVLVALDGGDDVAHLGATAAGQGGEQGAVADDDEVVGRLGDHEVVLDADDVGALAAQHPAAQDAHRLDGGGAVEGSGGGRAPVDDERLVVVVAHAEPADVAGLALGVPLVPSESGVVEVEAAEDQALVLGVEVERRRAALKTRASRSNSPVSSSSRTSPVRSVRPRARPSASTRPARAWALVSSA